LTLLSKLRDAPERSEQAWVTLAGQLRLLEADSGPRFEVSEDPLTLDDPELESEDATEPQRPRRFFFFDFDETSFPGAVSVKVPLPELPPEVRHLEVAVELKVGGATESAAEVNDVLDKPLNRQLLDVSPVLCLDTPVDEPSEHNLVFLAAIPDDPFEVESLRLGADELVDGETFFQTQGQVFFRSPSKPVAPVKGVLQTTDGRIFDFELGVAQNLRERMNSLAEQLEHTTAMADAAALQASARGSSADDAELVRDRLLSELFARKARLLDSIESTLTSQQDFAAFFSRAASLPAVLGVEDEESELA
jgi:hypothetical protein